MDEAIEQNINKAMAISQKFGEDSAEWRRLRRTHQCEDYMDYENNTNGSTDYFCAVCGKNLAPERAEAMAQMEIDRQKEEGYDGLGV